jgi:uncharacterized membrane protein YjfL (UPF0719 family)
VILNVLFSVALASCLTSWPLLGQASEVTTVLKAYLVTFGWAIVGSVAMGVGIIIALKLFTLATHDIDEWKLIGEGNMAMAVVLAAIILSLGIVIAAAVQP